jgi:hypothetical protein
MHTLSAHFCMLKAIDETDSAAPNLHDSPQLGSAIAMDMGTDSSGGPPDQYIAQKQWATKQQVMRRHNLTVAETRSQRRAKTIADPKNPTRRQINWYTEHQEALRTRQSKRRKQCYTAGQPLGPAQPTGGTYFKYRPTYKAGNTTTVSFSTRGQTPSTQVRRLQQMVHAETVLQTRRQDDRLLTTMPTTSASGAGWSSSGRRTDSRRQLADDLQGQRGEREGPRTAGQWSLDRLRRPQIRRETETKT